jgi:hypothetical protein
MLPVMSILFVIYRRRLLLPGRSQPYSYHPDLPRQKNGIFVVIFVVAAITIVIFAAASLFVPSVPQAADHGRDVQLEPVEPRL